MFQQGSFGNILGHPSIISQLEVEQVNILQIDCVNREDLGKRKVAVMDRAIREEVMFVNVGRVPTVVPRLIGYPLFDVKDGFVVTHPLRDNRPFFISAHKSQQGNRSVNVLG
jgi:hypothetical protein